MYIKKATTENKFKQKRFDKRSLSLNRKNLKKGATRSVLRFLQKFAMFLRTHIEENLQTTGSEFDELKTLLRLSRLSFS